MRPPPPSGRRSFSQIVAEFTRRDPNRPKSRSRSRSPADERALKLGYLKQVDILAPLSPEEHLWVADNTTMVTCPRGRVFYTPDDAGEVIFLLKQGRVSLYRLTPDGRKLTVGTLNAGTCFGEMGLLGQGMYGCHAEAATDCLLCVMSRSDLQALMRRNPEVAIRLLDVLGARLLEREQELEQLAFRGIPARLAALLPREADAFGTVSGRSHQDLADRLGTYRETVSQTLGRFRAEGLVAVEPKPCACSIRRDYAPTPRGSGRPAQPSGRLRQPLR